MSAPWDTPETRQWIAWLCAGYRRVTAADLVADDDPQQLYDIDAVVVSHRCAEDPCFVYANRAAQRVWGYAWDEFIGLPSRLSAPPEERETRHTLVQGGLAQGVIRLRDAIRIRADGQRFRVDEIVLWNVSDDAGVVIGQAATYSRFTPC